MKKEIAKLKTRVFDLETNVNNFKKLSENKLEISCIYPDSNYDCPIKKED